MSSGLEVSRVLQDSIAEEMDIRPGDIIIEANGREVYDILDLQYLTAEDEFTLLIAKQEKNEIWELKIEKEPGEQLGIELYSVSAGGLKKCVNNCVFCFVQQMPPGLRQSLYVRDDDYRLSVTQGSYITLSNLSDKELQRIIDMHISPLYISVHAWNPEVRKRLMRNPETGKLAEQIRKLAEAGLTLHTQVVLVPGYNDGQILQETVDNLAYFYPAVQSVGIVPVGLTRYRDKLPLLRVITEEEAQKILCLGILWQKKYKSMTGKNIVYFSDEFYVLAEKDFPEDEEYDGYPQLENGIGMIRRFKAEFKEYLHFLPQEIPPRRIHLITGVSAAGFFRDLIRELGFIKGLKITVHEIANNFFGSSVTVAGLLTAQDIALQVGNLEGERFLISRVMLKADEDIFLDGYDIAWLEKQVNGQAVLADNNGQAFLKGLLGKRLEG